MEKFTNKVVVTIEAPRCTQTIFSIHTEWIMCRSNLTELLNKVCELLDFCQESSEFEDLELANSDVS